MKKLILASAALLLAPLATYAGAFNGKIMGGTKASFGEWPSTVALLDVDEIKRIETGNALDDHGNRIPVNQANYQAHFCGASLIDPEWVLTAAHCLVENNTTKKADKVAALIGAYDLIGGGYRRYIKEIIIHPKYDEATDDNDIALLHLKTRVNAPTIAISSDNAPNGTLAYAVGWGALDGTGRHYPSELYEVELPVIDQGICRSFFGAGHPFTDNMLCAGYKQGRKRDVCNGDSGGPLMANLGNGGYEQIGITSWGASCSDPGSYGAYTRLSKYKNWIKSKITSSSSEESGGGSMLFLLIPFLLLLIMQGPRDRQKKHALLILSKINKDSK